MTTSALPRCAAFVLLALCLSGADCGGKPPDVDPGELDRGGDVECSNFQESGYAKATGRFDVTVNGRTEGSWRLAVSVVPRPEGVHEVWFSGCVLAGGGVEMWRYSSIAFLEGPVRGETVKLPVPQSRAPGFTGGLLDVIGNREHHFLLRGAGELEVQEFDPVARRFVARGEMYPEQGGTVTLAWDVTW